MTKKPLINHKFDQIDNAERPRHVAPGGRSWCWERPQVVAVGHRSRLVRRSQIDTTRATSGYRCGEVALGAGATSPCLSRRSLRSVNGERPQGLALVRSLRSVNGERPRGLTLVRSLRSVNGERVHGVAPVGSLPCTARPMITLITSFELQMHPNVPKNSMWYSNT
ncbi:hypothetical protein DY000_02013800 [Brassica cretica]|uniref:Uncharacterized protein n=1 Tax=Brassica cretica TaxID=69181 RepID=A0ABQ7CSB7_BRACR|nr:hypothetical protein DY000_02013800 [Brassica cretica]